MNKKIVIIIILILTTQIIGAFADQNILQIWKGDVPLRNGTIYNVEIRFLSDKSLIWIERYFDNKLALKNSRPNSENRKEGKYIGFKKERFNEECLIMLPKGITFGDKDFEYEPKGPSCMTYYKKDFLCSMYILPDKLYNLNQEEQKHICQRY